MLLETRGLSHTYSAGTPFERTAIEHIDLGIDSGEFLGIIGHTGSGKSTLIQHFNALLKPTAGQVLFEGKDVWSDPAGRESILQNLRDYREKCGAAIVMVSHSMEEIAASVERIVVMNHGRIQMDGSPREIFSRSAELTEIGLDVPQVTQVFARLRDLGLELDPGVYTVEAAASALLALRGGRHA